MTSAIDEIERARAAAARGENRKKALAEVAERVFLTHGFTDSTMNLIAREAKASKETLYRHFLSKEVLFCEIMRNKAAQVFGPGEFEPNGPPDEALHRIGLNLLKTLLKPESLAMLRVVIAETPRAPDLGQLFWAAGPIHVQVKLTAYIEWLVERNLLVCEDPALACRVLLGAIIASHHMLALIAPSEAPPPEDALSAHVHEAVGMFLARYGASRT